MLRAQADKAKPGLKGNPVLDVFREAAADSGGRKALRQRLDTLPAIPFEG